MATQAKTQTLDITPLMTPERIIGVLIYALSHDILDDEIFALADSLPEDIKSHLEGDLDNMVGMLWGANRDPRPIIREGILDLVKDEIRTSLPKK